MGARRTLAASIAQSGIDDCGNAEVIYIPITLLRNISRLSLLLFLSIFTCAQENVSNIIERSAEANKHDWEAVPQFDNYERDRTKDGDKTYSVTMLYGTPYERLIAINGHSLSAARQKEEQEKYEEQVAKREHESPDERAKRVAKYNAERKRDQAMLDQMTSAFDFRLVGNRTLNGREVYVFKATPRRGYRPPNRDSEVLTGMEGTLWIDRQTFQWVKVEAHVTHPVRIEGFLAQVEPGTRFELEKKPVAEGVWLAAHFAMRSDAKVMLLVSRRNQEDDRFFNYHRAAANPAAKDSNKPGQ